MITTGDLAAILDRPGYELIGDQPVKNKGGRPRKPKTGSEHQEQVKLFLWANSGDAQDTYPELEWMFAIPNGGKRHPVVAMAMKREGVKAGVLDIMLPVARGGWHGLFVELKYGDNWLSPKQDKFTGFVHDQGYAVAVCKSAEEAQGVIVDYLEGRLTQ